MRKISTLICLTLYAGTASAITTNITKLPNQVNDGSAAVGAHGDYPTTTFSNGSWRANGADYSKLYITPLELFSRDNVTIGELAYISYFTKKDGTHTSSAPDWYFQIYTKPYNGSPGGWYGNRLNSEPYFSQSLNDPSNTWNLWQTDADIDNRLRFYDSSSGYSGGYNDPFLSDYTSLFFYMNQEILYIAVGTNTDWANGFYGQIDGLSIMLSNGDIANVNFETMPAPGAFLLTGIGIVFVIKYKKRGIL